MYKYQTLSKDQLVNAILCFADRVCCVYCPCKDECMHLDNKCISCEKMLMNYLTEEIPQPKTLDFYEGFSEGFNTGYEACKRDIINKLQKGREKK